MLSIFKKEFFGFLNSFIAYITISVFLVINGLFVWVFPDTSILDYGYSNLDPLFTIAPWVFLFLVPAITMKSFSEERKTGTIEMISTKPLTDLQIILGKYFAGLSLVLFSLIPTLIYYISVYQLGVVPGNIDSGAVIGSYIGLFLLGSAFVAIGIFCSSLSDNQIVAFILSVFFIFIAYYGFESLSALQLFSSIDNYIVGLGINDHYMSISRGVLDTRDLIYFLSFDAFFILLTSLKLKSRKW